MLNCIMMYCKKYSYQKGDEDRGMEIRKHYFTDWQEELRQLEEESKRVVMTVDEQKEEDRGMQRRLEDFYARVEKEQSQYKRTLDLKKMKFFEEMSQEAIAWAEGVTADLYAGTITQFCGKIEFRTDMILLNEDTPSVCRTYFMKLVETADDVSFYIDGNVFVMGFYYNLYTEDRM